ncbi:TPA: hypothetical protein I7551_14345 [Vibrio cholerae]|nr:hypothetical protein [Vibrio cholerae]
MMRDLVSEFVEYKKKVSIDRVRASQVPAELRPLYDCYIGYLMNCLSDPDEQSIEILGPNERHNAMAMVKCKFGIKQQREQGNCPRCGGSGVIIAYRHIMNGKCLKCDGSGWIKP